MPDSALRLSSSSPFTNTFVPTGGHIPAAGSPFADAGPDVSQRVVRVLAELHDPEFDAAVLDVAEELARRAEQGATPTVLQLQLEPLAANAEAVVDHFAADLERAELAGELESSDTIDRLDLDTPPLHPAFENFLGALKKKLKKVASAVKRGVQGAAKVAGRGLAAVGGALVAQALAKLRAVVRPLIQRVLERALGKIPPALQEPARRLAASLGITLPAETPELEGLAAIQSELDLTIAHTMGATQDEAEARISEYRVASNGTSPDLVAARARLSAELAELPPGGDATPAIERFAPALLPLLKVGIRLAGRDRVVRFIAQQVGRLTRKLVGAEAGDALARAITDAGLGALGLETPLDRDAGARALGSTIEDTLRSVAELGPDLLDDEERLAAATVEAFHRAAARNLPPILESEAYAEHPELVTDSEQPWSTEYGRTHAYKKLLRPIDVQVTPEAAAHVRSIDGTSLGAMLARRFGVRVAKSFPARVRVFEAMAGTTPAAIAAREAEVGSWRMLFPLDAAAAALLLRRPDLATPTPWIGARPAFPVAAGRRFLALVPSTPALGAPARPSTLAAVDVGVDPHEGSLRLHLVLDEEPAIDLARLLQRRAPAGIVAERLAQRLATALAGQAIEDFRWPPLTSGALASLPSLRMRELVAAIPRWFATSVAEQLRAGAFDLAAAADDPAIGVTVIARFESVEGLQRVGAALRGEPVVIIDAWFARPPARTTLQVAPGVVHA